MDYIFKNNTVKVEGVKGFALGDTLMCGQSFRWRENEDGSFMGTAFGKTVTVKIENDDFYIIGTTKEEFESIWRGYFDLDTDYEAIRNNLSRLHPTLCEAAKFAPGIRILRQEPFEALISFIISQNNNIKRIEGIVTRLCENFGTQNQSGEYTFPSVETLSKLSVEDLAPIRAGFRHRYIIDASQKVATGQVDLSRCNESSFEDAKAELMTIVGVGEKVADCVCLYGLHKINAFPMDVWMKRAMKNLFPGVDPKDFGDCAGVAQQYIFHYSRLHPELFDE